MSEEAFYVGYEERAPGELTAFLRPRLLALFGLVVAIGGSLAFSMAPFSRSHFEFGTLRTLQGTYHAQPAPSLALPHPLATTDDQTRALIVAFGKFGAGQELAEFDGQAIELQGTLVYRDEQTMIELASGTAKAIEEPALPTRSPERVGTQTLRGEIVDSKCYLGVMKPAHSKPHRACAVRCISGGIPPVLMVRDPEGRASYYLLTDVDGGTVNQAVLPFVAEPVEITGEVLIQDNWKVLRADPATLRRLDR